MRGMKRSIWFWVYFVTAVIMATYLAVRVIMTFMGMGALSRVHNISVSADMRHADLTAVAAAAAIPPNTPTYSIDLDTMAARIGAVPGVRTCAVRRLPNGNLTVRVKMYRAVAQWTDGENFFPISADGTIVRRPVNTRDVASVVFRGPVPDDISDITKAAHTLASQLDYMEWIENRRWNMHMMGGITVMLPEQNPVAAIGALITLNQKHAILNREITLIDMRDDARILVK